MACRRVSILGSTGSVGSNTLDVIRKSSDQFEVVSLSCGSSLDVLLKQMDEFRPRFVSVGSQELADALRLKLGSDYPCSVFAGTEGHKKCIEEASPDVLMSSMSGTYGLSATLAAIEANVPVLGIANKEILVMAGPFVMKALERSNTELVPVDSEHSAIFQALMGNDRRTVKKIVLTASGGPFRTLPLSEFSKISKDAALRHPNWVMGSKITIDSATMMNKGLEYIEAIRLFSLKPEQVEVVIHPESVIHSMVNYCDGSFMAQLGVSDMRIPISLALAYPERLSLPWIRELDLVKLGQLRFEAPDFRRFPCLEMAMESEKIGTQGPIILNAANEVAVDMFLHDQTSFLGIADAVHQALDHFASSSVDSLEEAIELDSQVKSWVLRSRFIVSEVGRRSARVHETLQSI